MQRATFGCGCFWGTQHFFSKEFESAGKIKDLKVGYIGGPKVEPTYDNVCSGKTGHAEALTFTYSSEVNYVELLEFFFRIHNSTTLNRQGNDQGTQYRSAIFYHSPEQKQVAEKFISELNDPSSKHGSKYSSVFGSSAKCVTTIENGDANVNPFWDAESYHQNYAAKNVNSYCNHRFYFPSW